MKILPNNIAILENDTCLCKWIQSEGRLDHDQNSLPGILKLIRPGDTVVDVGAFIGDHTIAYARAVQEHGNVYAFEPNPAAFECLEHNMQLFNSVICINKALGSEEGSATLNLDNNVGASHLTAQQGPIKIGTLDIELAGKPVQFIKIDVEGFELQTLKGATNTITKFKPIMYIEVNEGALNRQGTTGKELMDYIVSLGYRLKGVELGPQFDVFCFPV